MGRVTCAVCGREPAVPNAAHHLHETGWRDVRVKALGGPLAVQAVVCSDRCEAQAIIDRINRLYPESTVGIIR